jgi:hypothetical protein
VRYLWFKFYYLRVFNKYSFQIRSGDRPDSRPRFWILTGSSGSFFYIKKLKQHHFSKKTKVNGLNRVTPGFFFLYFFFNLTRFQPQIDWVPDRPAGPGFKTMLTSLWYPPRYISIFNQSLINALLHLQKIFLLAKTIFFLLLQW